VSIGLSILSWRGAKSLRPALESYQSSGLFDIFDEAQIYLPDPDKAVLDVAAGFEIRLRASPKNLGIMGNMIAAAQQLSTDYILMLENDCPLIEPLDEVKRQLKISIDLLEREDVIMSRLRSVREPGQAFTGLEKYRRLYILINREFFLNKIIPMAVSVKTKRHANHLPNLEIEMNKSRQWRRSGWKIACGLGLFTHERIGDRGYL